MTKDDDLAAAVIENFRDNFLFTISAELNC